MFSLPSRHLTTAARPVVEVCLREGRPREVCLRVFASAGGKPMRSCILTATMGNYARLRRLFLKDGVEESRRLYNPLRPVFAGFAAHRQWGISEMLVARGRPSSRRLPTSLIRAHALQPRCRASLALPGSSRDSVLALACPAQHGSASQRPPDLLGL